MCAMKSNNVKLLRHFVSSRRELSQLPVISVPRTLRQQLGDDGADDLVNLINRATEDAKEDTLVLAGERYERRLSEEISGVKQNIAETRAELQTQLAETKSELIRWMFIFWVGQLAAMLGILFVFFS
ncbi:MAG: hypothetical protein MAG451_00496 [Anaerolineales bacterium]|nr:hypothetical protein [Anaerolineales bacterium]